MARIFLCHAYEDKDEVEGIYDRLRKLGFEPWMDKRDLRIGQRWQDVIPQMIRDSALVIVFLSATSVSKKGYVQREFKLALDVMQEMPEDAIYILPVRLDDCEVPNLFKSLHWGNLFEPNGFDRLVDDIRYSLGEPKPETKVVAAFDTFTNDLGMTFVRIQAGEFWMGSPDSDPQAMDDEKPQHRVTISQPFYLGVHQVTQAQWEAVMGGHPSKFTGDPQRPVENVSWHMVQDFISKLNEHKDGHIYRLPTEAEWEYACRAGSSSIYCFGDDEAQLSDYAWYGDNSGYTTHPVGEKRANVWGLFAPRKPRRGGWRVEV